MNARDLIEQLQQLDPDTEIRYAHQPNYPFEYSMEPDIAIVTIKGTEIAYLVENSQIGYLPLAAAIACQWADAEEDEPEEEEEENEDGILPIPWEKDDRERTPQEYNEPSDDQDNRHTIDRF